MIDLSKIDGYQKLKQRVKLHNGNLLLWLEDDKLEATSYGHWKFITNMEGIYIFNWYSYSNTTRKHQCAARSIMQKLGLNYITVNYGGSLTYMTLDQILVDKIAALYQKENNQALSKARKYAVYTEEDFNNDLADIKKIAAALKISDKKLNEMLLESQDAANNTLIEELVNDHEAKLARREIIKKNNDLSAIQL